MRACHATLWGSQLKVAMKKFLHTPLLAAMAAGALMSACGGGSTAPGATTGVFLDAAVENLDYAAGTAAKKATNAKGEFTCNSGETVTFSVGGVVLGSAPCGAVITPLTLAGGTDIKADKVVNRLLTLQSLDEDGDPSNGIKLTAEVKTALASSTMDFSLTASDFNTALTTALSTLSTAYKDRTVDDVKRTLVQEHFEDTLASKVGTPVGELVSQTNSFGTVTATITRMALQADKSFYIPYEGTVQAIKNDFPDGFLPAYGSGLAFKSKQVDGTLEFYAITDRGPNGDGPMLPNNIDKTLCYTRKDGNCDAKLFPAPSFAPAIGVVTVSKVGAVLKSSLPIRVSSTLKTSGLPAGLNQLGASGETPLTDNLKYEASTATTFSTNGLDPESLVVDTARNALWTSDEYGPFIFKIDPVSGIILKKYGPSIPTGSAVTATSDITTVLPSVLAKRRANRGMEGLALDVASGKLHGFLQSPLTDLTVVGAPAAGTYVAPAGSNCAVPTKDFTVERYARFTRWVEFDPATEISKMYAYPINCADYKDNRTGNAKLGDMVSLGNGKFIVIEQGASSATGNPVFNRLMLVEIGSATDINGAAFNPTTSDLEKSSMAGAAVNSADFSGVTTIKKTLLLDLNAVGWLAEKAEGLALVDAMTLALTSDNDFGLRNIVFDAAGVEISGADITKCTSTDGVLTGGACTTGSTSRVGRGSDAERPTRLWLIKFGKNLADYSVPVVN
jgi:hypothetical protein